MDNLKFSAQELFFRKSFFWILILCTLFFIYMAHSFLMPFTLATLLVFFTQPIYDFIVKIVKNCYLSSFLSLLVVFLVFVLPMFLFIYWSYHQAYSLFVMQNDKLSDFHFLLTPLWTKVISILNYLNLDLFESDGSFNSDLVISYIQPKIQIILNKVFSGGLLLSKNIFNILFQISMSVLFAFYFYIDGRLIVRKLLYIIPLEKLQKQKMLQSLMYTIQSSVKGVSVIGFVQGFLGGLTLWICGFEAPIFWGLMMFVLSIIPAVGVFVILIPCCIILYFEGSIFLALFALFSCFSIGGIDYILRPLIMSKKAQLHDLLVIVSTLGGIQFFGIIGFLLGPALASVMMSLFKFHQEYLKKS